MDDTTLTDLTADDIAALLGTSDTPATDNTDMTVEQAIAIISDLTADDDDQD